jgi:predicted homoserine dehydrogenase-like protein
VNVEADVLAGPLLAEKAREKGVVYSMAYSDQPELVSEMVDWARSAGFAVAAAGKEPSTCRAITRSRPTRSGATTG